MLEKNLDVVHGAHDVDDCEQSLWLYAPTEEDLKLLASLLLLIFEVLLFVLQQLCQIFHDNLDSALVGQTQGSVSGWMFLTLSD